MNEDSVFVVKSRKGYRTRRSLLDTAFGLIASDGIAAVSIAQICASAGLKRSSFYTHFENLTDLLSSVSLRVQDELGEKFLAADLEENLSLSRLEKRLRFVLNSTLQDSQLGHVLYELYTFHEPTSAQIETGIRSDLSYDVANGLIHLDGDDIDAFAKMVSCTILGTMRVMNGRVTSFAQREKILRLLMRAISHSG